MTAVHYRAVELRYEGLTYREIAKILSEEYDRNIKEQTLRWWFKSGGRCEKHYLDYANKESERRRRLIHTELKKTYNKIPAKLDALLERLDAQGKEKLDMVTIKTIEKIVQIIENQVGAIGANNDVLDQFWDRVEKDIEEKEDELYTDQENSENDA